MHTTDNQGTVEPGLLAAVKRDARVVWRMVMMVGSYFVVGGKVRRAVRRAARRGETYFVDDHNRRA